MTPSHSSLRGLLLVVALSQASCGTTVTNAPDASDAAADVTDASKALVHGGEACSPEGAQAQGVGPWCTDTGGSQRPCTCRAGVWDCGKCPDCAIDLRAPPYCTICSLCNGGSATRCDGTSFTPKVCRCGCAMWNEWNCVDSADKIYSACPSDASTD